MANEWLLTNEFLTETEFVSATCTDAFTAADVVATGSAAANACSTSGVRLGEPLVTTTAIQFNLDITLSVSRTLAAVFVASPAASSSLQMLLYRGHADTNYIGDIGVVPGTSLRALASAAGEELDSTASATYRVKCSVSGGGTAEIPFVGLVRSNVARYDHTLIHTQDPREQDYSVESRGPGGQLIYTPQRHAMMTRSVGRAYRLEPEFQSVTGKLRALHGSLAFDCWRADLASGYAGCNFGLVRGPLSEPLPDGSANADFEYSVQEAIN